MSTKTSEKPVAVRFRYAVPKDDSEGDSAQPMQFREIQELALGIANLPGEMIGSFVGIVRACEPSLSDSNADEIEVDFTTLKSSTLRELERCGLSGSRHVDVLEGCTQVGFPMCSTLVRFFIRVKFNSS